MTDDKKKPEDETPQAQAEDAKPAEDLSDEELGKAAGGNVPPVMDYAGCSTFRVVNNTVKMSVPDGTPIE